MPTFKLGLTGFPLRHSLSPKIHTVALNVCGLEGDYSLFPVAPDNKQGLMDLLARVRNSEIRGLNVTIPHKQNVIEFLDGLTPTAKTIGAVNVIYMKEGKLIGDNTDALGFLSDLKRVSNSVFSFPRSALVLGAGGSARAVVYALANDGWKVTIAARRLKQALELASRFEEVVVVELNVQTFKHSNAQLIVNTTPLGMTPNIDSSPLPDGVTLFQNTFVYDLVYNPRDTKLVRDARSQGLQATTGLGMLIEQAALAFEIWTKQNPPRDILWNAVEY